MKKIANWALLLGFGCGGCASAPTLMPEVYVVRTEMTFDQVWANVIEVFATENITIKTLEKDSGIIVAEPQAVDIRTLRRLSDCGSMTFHYVVDGTVGYNVFVREVGGAREVRVNSRITGNFDGPYDSRVVRECISRGAFERSLLEWVVRKG